MKRYVSVAVIAILALIAPSHQGALANGEEITHADSMAEVIVLAATNPNVAYIYQAIALSNATSPNVGLLIAHDGTVEGSVTAPQVVITANTSTTTVVNPVTHATITVPQVKCVKTSCAPL